MARRHPEQIVTSHGEGAYERAEETGDHKTLAEIEKEMRALGFQPQPAWERKDDENDKVYRLDLTDYFIFSLIAP